MGRLFSAEQLHFFPFFRWFGILELLLGIIGIKFKFLTSSGLFIKAPADMLVEYNIYNLFTAITNISKRLMCLQQKWVKAYMDCKL